ncbi:MAG: pirin family protein [Gammaproteobacteria bacterium]
MMNKLKARQMQEGAGVTVYRLMPIAPLRNYDPFVLWDDFTLTPGTGFPDHPHRGFEAVTYLFNGSLRHEDNLGNASTVQGGGAQRFTAGSGIVHSEMPNEVAATRGIQLWINLPRRLKQVEPGYQQVNHDEFPVREVEGARIKTLVGPDSPLRLLTPVNYFDIQLKAGATLGMPVAAGMRGLIYLLEGEISANAQNAGKAEALFFEAESLLSIEAAQAVRLMLCYGRPHGEPIVQHGPYVD